MKHNFESFDENIGVDGYCKIFKELIFPGSTPTNVVVSALNLECFTIVKGQTCFRARKIPAGDVEKFLHQPVTAKEFYPPETEIASTSIGRFNAPGERTLYLSNSLFVAVAECDINVGDTFLFCQIEFIEDIHLVSVKREGGELSECLSNLMQSKDKRFYPVIKKVTDDFLKYDGYHGIAYTSVKNPAQLGDLCFTDNDLNMNFAIYGDFIQKTKLTAGFFAQSTVGGDLERVMFLPEEDNPGGWLSRFSYFENCEIYVQKRKETTKKKRTQEEKVAERIKNAQFSTPPRNPVKVFEK